ncbi:TauD/TfdA family dioxygenase [Mesorhizobium sp. WSM2561]|uniref:TauD/TfdA dioxygenase family protein n=1 Tax=Mesorhizobium sp. WSM2561 TaxID=1040985 RepID=UPI00068834F4|nr:TauD/TfdA family dioxygenase [Mesorhizobium sp. WSM2561]
MSDINTSVMTVTPASPFLGADVTGISVTALIRSPDAAVVQTLKQALDQFLVLRFQQPALTDDEIVGFANLFGTILSDRKNTEEMDSVQPSGRAELKVLSNATASDGRPVGDKGAAAQIWHTDGCHRETPNAYSVLYARKAPDNPPRTGFMSSYTLYEKLPSDLKKEISTLRAVFSVHNRSQDFNTFMAGASVEDEKRAEGPRHPLVRLHPSTNRPFLYLPRRRDALIEGYSSEQSRNLLERLWAAVFSLSDQWRVALQANDFVIFDNRAVLHNREGWESTQDRTVFHLALEGETPIAAFAPKTVAKRGRGRGVRPPSKSSGI